MGGCCLSGWVDDTFVAAIVGVMFFVRHNMRRKVLRVEKKREIKEKLIYEVMEISNIME